jgi:hypothetical protein
MLSRVKHETQATTARCPPCLPCVILCRVPVNPRAVKFYFAALIAVTAVELVTIWIPAYNALTDFPIHIVRAYILAHYNSSALYQHLFQKAVLPNPNMAIDYLATPLVPFLGLVASGKVFLSILMILFNLGCHALGRAIQGAFTWMSIACAMLAFHGAYQYGFVNYSFSIALLLVVLAFWYWRRDSWTAVGLVFLTVLLTMLFISHLAGFGVAGIILFYFWISEIVGTRHLPRRVVLEAVTFLPAALIWVSLPRGPAVTLRAHAIVLSTPADKLAGAFTLFRSGSNILDLVTCAFLALFFVIAFRYRDQHARPVLYAGLLLCLLFLLIPKVFLVPEASGVDVRLIVPGLLLVMLALRLPDSKLVRTVGLSALVLLSVRLVYQFELFRRASFVSQDVVRLVDQIPAGVSFWMTCDQGDRILRQNIHSGAYALATSGAIESNYIAIEGQQPIWFRHPEPVTLELTTRLTRDVVRQNFSPFQYAVVCGFARDWGADFAPYGANVAADGPCSLWRRRSTASSHNAGSFRSSAAEHPVGVPATQEP